MKRFSAQVKEEIVLSVVEKNQTITEVSKEYGVARKTIYQWIKLYNKGKKKTAEEIFAPKYVRGSSHPRKISTSIESEILNKVESRPDYTIRDLTKESSVSIWTVWNILNRHELNSREDRVVYSEYIKSSAGEIYVTNLLFATTDYSSIRDVKDKALFELIQSYQTVLESTSNFYSTIQETVSYGTRYIEGFNLSLLTVPFSKITDLPRGIKLPQPDIGRIKIDFSFSDFRLSPAAYPVAVYGSIATVTISITVLTAISIYNGNLLLFEIVDTPHEVAISEGEITKTAISTSFVESKGDLKLAGERGFGLNKEPKFTVESDNEPKVAISSFTKVLSAQDQNNELSENENQLTDESKEIGGVSLTEISPDVFEVSIDKSNLAPGKYEIRVDDGSGNTIIQEFTWGVLAVNTNKSIYQPNEVAKLAFAVLDEGGHMACDAQLDLTIEGPQEGNLSTSKGSIQVNEECQIKGYTETPDFSGQFQVGNSGVYNMTLTATTKNGEYTIRDSFEVRNEVAFDIERHAPTRIYPLVNYPVRLDIKANQDYQGVVQERLPSEFEIVQVNGVDVERIGSDPKISIGLDEDSNEKIISWNIDLEKGEQKSVNYLFDAPDISPEYYTLGPLSVGEFEESRLWQIASDATASMILFWDNPSSLPTTADGTWTCLSCGSGDFYQKFIRGASDYNTTGGGSATHTHTATGTVSTPTGASGDQRSGSGFSDTTHTHTYTPVISSSSNLPSYRQLRVIQAPVTGEPTEIPAGAIAVFTGELPSGWTRYSDQDGYYIRGENTIATGGSNTHTHTITGTTSGGSTSVNSRSGSGGNVAVATHTHTVSSSTGSVNNEPPYIEAILAKKDSTGSASNGMIAMWNKTSGDSYPSSWVDRSGSGQPFNGKFIKPVDEYGATGGSESHSHSNVTGIVTSAPSSSQTVNSGTGNASSTHTHTVSVTSFSTSNHLPPYIDVAFAERNASVTISGNVYQAGTTTASIVCDGTTSNIAARIGEGTISTSCDASTGYFQFTEADPPVSGDGIVIWINDEDTDGASVIKYAGPGASSNNIVYEDTVTVMSDNTTPVAISDMNFFDNQDDSDIPYTATEDTTDTLVVNSGFDLLVKLKSGVANGSTVLDPNGTITLSGGDLHLDDNVVAYLDTDTNSIGNDILVGTGAFLYINADTNINGGNLITSGTALVDTNAGTPTVTVTNSSSGNIGGGSSTISFYNLTISGTGTTLLDDTSSGGMVIDNDVSVTTGATLDMNSKELDINGGDLTTAGTGTVVCPSCTDGGVILAGAGTIGGGGSVTVYELTLEGATNTTTLGSDLTSMNFLNIGSNRTLDSLTYNVTVGDSNVSGAGDVIINGATSATSGTFTIKSSDEGTATLSGSGTLAVYNLTLGDGTNNNTIDADTNDVAIDVNNDLTITASTTLLSSDLSTLNIGGNYLNSGTFTHNQGTVVFDSIASSKTINAGSSSFYNLIFDDDGNSGSWSVTSTNLTIDKDLTITGGNLTAPSGNLTITGNFTNSDSFTHNSGTVVFDAGADSTQNLNGSTTFNNLTATGGDRILKFASGSNFTIAENGNITLTGTDCSAPLVLRSASKGSTFTLTDSTGGTTSISYVDVQDSTASPSISASNSVDSGGNTSWTIAAGSCLGASTVSTNTATAYSFQRKTFYDSANQTYWMFYHDGDEIEPRYSSNGSTWNSDTDRLGYDTNDFSVWYEQIGSTEYVFVALAFNNDIIVKRGTITNSSVTWDEEDVVALDGTSSFDKYSYSFVSLDTSGYLWVGARYFNGTFYVYKTVRSDDTDTGEIETWGDLGFGNTIDVIQLTADEVQPTVYGNIVPLADQNMYTTFVTDTELLGCKWNHSNSEWQDSLGSPCKVLDGSSDIDIEDVSEHTLVNIDDSSDFGALSAAGRQLVRTSSGNIYAVLRDDANILEVWKSTDGETWSEQDSSNKPTCATNCNDVAIAIDNSDIIHILWQDYNSSTLNYTVNYVAFSTSTDTFGTPENVSSVSTRIKEFPVIAIDANGIPHIALHSNNEVLYTNRIGGSWKSAVVVESITPSSLDMTINEGAGGGIPEIAYINSTDDDLTVAVGNTNNASSFTLHDVDTEVNDTAGQRGVSIAVDTLTGDTWIAYVDSDGSISLATHTGSTWTSDWTTITDKAASGGSNELGSEPSIAIAANSQIYVFYENDQDDITYDIFDTKDNSWGGETVLHTGTYQDVKTKWSFEWNNFGANRIDYLYSNGTEVFWDYLYVRGSPVKIHDNTAGSIPVSGKQVVRNSDGDLYMIDKSGIYASTDDGGTWSEQDSGDQPTIGDWYSIAIDSSDAIHLIYITDSSPNDLYYVTFDTTTNQYGSPQVVHTSASTGYTGISLALDGNDKPHVSYCMDTNSVKYSNLVTSSWTDVTLESVSCGITDIVVNGDDIPVLAYINNTDDDLTLALGDDNNPANGEWTLFDVDSSVVDTSNSANVSLGIDLVGNTWVSYLDEDGTDDYVTLAKHTNGTQWDNISNWTIDITNSKVGFEPSIAVDGNNIYVFYQDDHGNIVYDKYDGVADVWNGETLLDQHGELKDVSVKWSHINNFDSDGDDGANLELDYVYSDGSDVYYNRLYLGLNTLPGSSDSIDTVPNNLSKNFSTVADGSGNVHILYVKDDTTDAITYKKWNGTAWGGAQTVDASDSNQYIALSLDTTSGDLYAIYNDSSNSYIYYKQCDVSSSSDCSTWGTETTVTSTNTNANVISNYNGGTKIFAAWTTSSSSPFAVQFSTILTGSGNSAPSAPTVLYVNNDTAQSGQESPVEGLVDHTPAFSAIYNDADTSDAAVYYQLQVGSDSDWSSAEMWDSNKTSLTSCTEGTRCSDITYAGSSLSDGQTYYWRIKYWDNSDDEGEWSATAQFSMNNTPTVSNVILNSASDINLTENTTTSISFVATITDLDGYEDISSVSGKAYRSGVTGGSSCSPDDSNCYEDISCILSSQSGNTATATCTVDIKYFAEPTDIGSDYEGEYWAAFIEVEDARGETGSATSSAGSPELNTLTALEITSTIAYGNITPGSDSGETNQVTVVTNTGNVAIDTDISGDNMCTDYPTCSGDTIAVGYQEYSGAAFTYGEGIILTSSASLLNLNLAKSNIVPSESTASIYWGIEIPIGTASGSYSGQNTVIAVKD